MKEHKHAAILRAIADGKEVEHKRCGEWHLATNDYLVCVADPFNNINQEWRIKPEPKPDVVLYVVLDNIKFIRDSGIGYKEIQKRGIDGYYPQVKVTFSDDGNFKDVEVIK